MSGKLIVCDGGNGAGKSTVMASIREHLSSKGVEFVSTREPGGTAIGEEIRKLILSVDNVEMCPTTELMLFAAARAQHVNELILPTLEKGVHVLSDRFESATVSFQQYGRNMSKETIDSLNNLSLGEFRPHMTIILDLDPKVGLDRKSGGVCDDRLELENLEFLERARQGYLEQAKAFPDRFTVIDASQSVEDVLEQVKKVVDSII